MRNRTSKEQDEKETSFWNREMEADATVRRDIDLDSLPYIKIRMQVFPKDMAERPESADIYRQIEALQGERILNLTGKTNTDLKLEYGRNHLDEMQRIGENFENLIILITSAGEYLYNQSRYTEAASVLEYGVSLKSDISKNYILLGDCYKALNETRKINSLAEKVSSMHLLMEKPILTHLTELTSGEEKEELESFSTEEG